MRISNFLLPMYLLLSYVTNAQLTSRVHSREVKLNNPQLLAKLKPFLQEQKKTVYICSSQVKGNQLEYTFQPVGYLSELKEHPTSLYIQVENSLIFVVTGIEPITNSGQFLKEVIRPLVRGRVVDDLLPNGQTNQDAVPALFHEQGIVVTLEQEKINVRWTSN